MTPTENNITITGVNGYICIEVVPTEENIGTLLQDVAEFSIYKGDVVCFSPTTGDIDIMIEGKSVMFIPISSLRGVVQVI